MTLTIIFLQIEMAGHGNPAMLDAAIECAKLWSPKSNIAVITDTPEKWAHLCECHCIHEYWDLADRYTPMYKHTSQLSANFEAHCIQRWMVMLQFMRKHKLDRIFHADSDVLIFSDLETERKKWENCEYTLSTDATNGCKQGGNAFMSLKAIEAFVAYVFSRDGTGGNDMGLFVEFANKFTNLKRGETTDIIDEVAGDHHLQCELWKYQSDLRLFNGHESKRIQWINGQPYAFRRDLVLDPAVRMMWLHCWGGHKQRMREYLSISRESRTKQITIQS